MKYELTNLSVIVVIKVDSEDRIRNLNYILDYYNQYFKGVEIVILEQGEQQLFFKQEGTSNLENTIVYHFIKDNGPHYKTRNLNLATRLATRKIIMMTDTDVFVEPKVLSKALCKMEKESSAILSPHNGVMVEVSKSFFSLNSKSELLDSLVFFPRSFKQKMDQFDLSNIYPIYGGEYFS
ncbi:hypothetical protein, partial [Ekhidna sp.]|uniref:hypothetical protein n=1 Tax=Ekhidna sp. TaxID=2608089 RepID=UPI0032993B44